MLGNKTKLRNNAGNIRHLTHDCRLPSCFVKSSRTSAGTRSNHSHLPGAPFPIADWKVLSWATSCRLLIAAIASFKNSVSGFPFTVSSKTAPRSTGYFWRCSFGRLRKCFRSSRGDSPERDDWWRPQCFRASYQYKWYSIIENNTPPGTT